MSARYAASTSVSSARSRDEIEQILRRYGATSFVYGWDPTQAVIQFTAQGRQIRFALPMPARDDPAFMFTPAKRQRRTAQQIDAAYEQAVRQRWRALALVIKAKLEAVEAGIAWFEDEFMAYVVLPDGGTVGEFMAPQIEQAYTSGAMPSALPMLTGGR